MEISPQKFEPERNVRIDALRGIAFLAVILLNLLGEFRVPFLLKLQHFHTEPGFLNHAVDWIVGLTLDQKGFTVLSFLFGIGIAIMTERNRASSTSILLRRFLFLFVLGLFHILFVFSGDILVLYSICGLMLIPLTFVGTGGLWTIAALFFAVRIFIDWPTVPFDASSTDLIQGAQMYYGEGSFSEVFSFRLFEFRNLIGPLLLSVWPRTIAVMLVGFLCWKQKWLHQVQQAPAGKYVGYFFLAIGTLCTGLEAYFVSNGLSIGRWNILVGDLGILGLAFGYTVFILRLPSENKFVSWFGPVGRLGLSTYLTQTTLLGLIFYGYGLGLFGKLGSFSASCLALGFYGIQIFVSKIYLSRFKHGPIEFVWRRLTYLGKK